MNKKEDPDRISPKDQRKKIAELIRVEEQLIEKYAFLDSIMEHSPFAMWVADNQGTVIKTNAALRDALQLSDEQIVGHYNVFNDQNLIEQGVMPQIKAVFESHKPARFSIFWESTKAGQVDFTGGRHLWIDVSIFPLLDEEGCLKNIICQWIDIDELKTIQQELLDHNANLELKIAERTRDLKETQEKLIRQERLAVMGELAGSVGHELRNPLGVITNASYYLNLALKDKDEKTAEYLDLIDREAKKASKIISDLLDYARVRPAEGVSFSIIELIDDVLNQLPLPDHIELQVNVAGDCPPVLADPGQIRQVMTNLINNAVQAMPDSGTLNIKGRYPSLANRSSYVIIEVKDTGKGIQAKDLNKVFEPLYTTRAMGVGLGLTISKKLAEANGGELQVERVVGQGTIFRLSLPKDVGQK